MRFAMFSGAAILYRSGKTSMNFLPCLPNAMQSFWVVTRTWFLLRTTVITAKKLTSSCLIQRCATTKETPFSILRTTFPKTNSPTSTAAGSLSGTNMPTKSKLRLIHGAPDMHFYGSPIMVFMLIFTVINQKKSTLTN